ncbi:uncharacterized protein LOC107271139 [Cephus cinctus]|uniref:Uncharacterized protein LOC107271139 n=1 Tax=Cephus cinctus TaxID=211228 RepID=A0AAJ7W513_CEPCN|nr:uncharacterized protein LOC107271139 [Cephus cinctus]
MGGRSMRKLSPRFIQFIGLSQAVFWSAPSPPQKNQGLKFPDAVCPCILLQECPKIFGSVPEDKDLGSFPSCQVDGYVRCCGLSSRRDARALNENHGKENLVTSSTTYREKYQLPPGIVVPVPFVYPEYIDSRKTVKVSKAEVAAPLISRPPLTPLALLRPLEPLTPLAPPPKLPPISASVTRPEITNGKKKLLAEITSPPVQKLPVGIHVPPVGFMYPEYLEEIKRKEAKDREEEINRKKATLQNHSGNFELHAFPLSMTNSQGNFNTPGVNNIRESSVSFQDQSQKETPDSFSATVHKSEKSSTNQNINGNQASRTNTQDHSKNKTEKTFPIVSASFEIHSKNEPTDASQRFSAKNTDMTGGSRKPNVTFENEDFGVASLDTVREIIASENALTKPDRIPEIAPFSPRRFPSGVTAPPLNFMYPEYVDLRKTKQGNENLRNFENTRIPVEQDEPEHIEIPEEEITPPPFEFVKSKYEKSKNVDAPVKSVERLRTLPVDIRKPLLFQKQSRFDTFENSQPDKKVTIETTPTENKTSIFSTLILNTLHNLHSSMSQLTSGISMNSATVTTTTTNIPPTITRSQTPITSSIEIQNIRPPQAIPNNHGQSEVRTFSPLIVPKIPVRLRTEQHEISTMTAKFPMLAQNLSETPQEKGTKSVVVQATDVALISGRIPQVNRTADIRLNAPMTRPKVKLPHRQGQSLVRNRGNVKHATSTIAEDYPNARVISQRQRVNADHVPEPQGDFQPRLRLPARSFEILNASQPEISNEKFSAFNGENIPEGLQRPIPSLKMPSQDDIQAPQVSNKHTIQHSGDGSTSESQRDQDLGSKFHTDNNNHERASIFRVTMTIGHPREILDRLPVVPTVPAPVEIVPSTAEIISSSVATVATTTSATPLAPVEVTSARTSTRTRPSSPESMRNNLIRKRPQYFPKKHEFVRQDSIMPATTFETKVGHLAGVNRHDFEDPEVQESLTFLEENNVNFGSRASTDQSTKFTSEGSGTTRDYFPGQRLSSETFTHDESVIHPNDSGVTKPVNDINVPVIDAPLNNKIRNLEEGPRRQFRRMMFRRRLNVRRDSRRGFPTDSTKIEPQSRRALPKENDFPAGIPEEKIQTNQRPRSSDTPTLNGPSLEAEEVTLLSTLEMGDNLQMERSSGKGPSSEESTVLPPISSNVEETRSRFRHGLRNPSIVKEETTVASVENISNNLTDNDVKYFVRRRPRPGRRTTTPESSVETSTDSYAVGRRIIRRRPGVGSKRRTLQDEENENMNVYEEKAQSENSESVRQRSSRKIKAERISVQNLEESETGTSLTAPETGILKINNTAASTGSDSNSSPDEKLINMQQEKRVEMSSNNKLMEVNLRKIKDKEEAENSSNGKRVVYETATSISVVRNGRVLTLDEVKLLNDLKKQEELEERADISDSTPSTLISFDSVPLVFSKLSPAEDHGDSSKTQNSGNGELQISTPTTPASGTMDDEILETIDKGSNEPGPIERDASASKKTHKSEETTKEFHNNLIKKESTDSLEMLKLAEDTSVDSDSVKPEDSTKDNPKKVMDKDVNDRAEEIRSS